MSKISQCCRCGFKWQTGLSGHHSCADHLENEVFRLRDVLKKEADYCYEWHRQSLSNGDYSRATRHKERGDRLMNGIKANN